jgi:tetratricopeptide (TPR) repeat protein
MDKNRDQDAARALNELLAMDGFDHLKHVARARLAKILLYQGKPEEVLSLLEGQENAAFAARYAEELGDAYVALGRYDEARTSYQAALGEAQPTVDQGLIQLKLFGDDDEELEPAELIDFETKVPVKRLWKTKIGADAEFLRVALRPMGDGNRIYAASVNGNVVALDPENGKQVWRNKLDVTLSSGPGVGEGLVVVITADGYVVALAGRRHRALAGLYLRRIAGDAGRS